MHTGACTMRKRILIAFILVCVVFAALFGRLFYLQIIDGKELKARAAEQWYRDLPLKAARGKILDCNGQTLADSKDVFTLYARPNAVKDKAKEIAKSAAAKGQDR